MNLFNNIFICILSILLTGTVAAHCLYIFCYKNQNLNITKNDTLYNIIKYILLISLGTSFLLFVFLLISLYQKTAISCMYGIFDEYSFTLSNIVKTNMYPN